jgi:hypothetical protein
MEITLIAGKTEYKVHTFYLANRYAYHIWELDNYSDLEYLIVDGDFRLEGSIDLEPRDFHRSHRRRILTNHLRTFWSNVAKCKHTWQVSEADKFMALEVLALIPNEDNL